MQYHYYNHHYHSIGLYHSYTANIASRLDIEGRELASQLGTILTHIRAITVSYLAIIIRDRLRYFTTIKDDVLDFA